MSDLKTLVVLPSYNERENIAELTKALLLLAPEVHVCVVDDSSPDGTADVVRGLAAQAAPADASRVHLLVRGQKDGRGSAVRAGIEWGLKQRNPAFDAFVEMDCDFSHDPAAIPRGLEALGQADVALGCRYPDGKILNWPQRRRVMSFLANLLARGLISWRIADYTGGFRFYSRRSSEVLLAVPQRHKGYIYLSEMISVFLKASLRIRCFPITFTDRRLGTSKTGVREVLSSLVNLMDIAWRHRFARRGGTP